MECNAPASLDSPAAWHTAVRRACHFRTDQIAKQMTWCCQSGNMEKTPLLQALVLFPSALRLWVWGCILRPKLLSGEDGRESHAGGCTQEPVLGGGFELLTAELQLVACSSMGFDGEHARPPRERSVRNQTHNVFRQMPA